LGIAAPYPSTINVSGMSRSLGTGFRVRLKNYSHTFPADVGVLLVSPSGQSHQLIAPIPGSGANPVSGITLTFVEGTTQTPLPTPLVTGTFRTAGGNQAYAAPANTFPRVGFLSAFVSNDLNGAWRLFVQDFAAGDSGSFAGGWEIEFFEIPVQRTSDAFTYQGRLDGGIADGTIDARFSLWSGPSSTNPQNLLAGPVSVNGIAINGGLFTAPVDLGIPLPTDILTWLQVEVASPSGSGFVTLSPRQLMTAAPLASVASGLGNVTSLAGGNLLRSGAQGISFNGTNSNVGIGTTTPTQRLDVRGNIALGNSGELRAPGGEENLRIIRGDIRGDNGTIREGSGFTFERQDVGDYVVTFNTAFSDNPTVTATAITNGPNINVIVVGLGPGVVQFRAFNASGALTDSNVHFIAIGPR